MFKGTVRSNLDPFEERPDAEMWKALDLVSCLCSTSGAGLHACCGAWVFVDALVSHATCCFLPFSCC